MIILSIIGMALTANAADFNELRKNTVKVTGKNSKSGGTGVIIASSKSSSRILTNAHVCDVAKKGGYVHTWKGKYAVKKYAKSKKHDLCILQVSQDLETKVRLAYSAPEEGDDIVVSGHPRLMPQMLSYGHLSGTMHITMFSGIRKCTPKDYKKHPFICWWFEGMPIIREYETSSVSAMIAPGSSGSAVYNSSDELVGLVFAGHGRGVSYGITVPYSYLRAFMRTPTKKLKWKVVDKGRSIFERWTSGSFLKDSRKANIEIFKDIDVAFPAIYDKEMDIIFNNYKCISQESSEQCLTK